MVWSSRQKIGVSLLLLLALFAWLSWQMVERAVLVDTASHFLVPGIFLICLMGALFLGSVLWQEQVFQWLAASFLTVPSLLVALSWVHVGCVLIVTLCVAVSLRRIQFELRERIHLSVRKSIILGLGPLLFGLSLLLTSQYYVLAQTLSWDRLVPSFNLGEGVGPMLVRIAAPFYPALRQLDSGQMTVDMFLRGIQNQNQPSLESLPQSMQKSVLDDELARAKGQLSQLLGREVQGGENVQMLLGEVVRRKTLAFLSSDAERLPVPILPLFLSFLLFLTLYPLFTIVSPVLIGVTIGLIWVMRSWGWIEIKTETVKREVIA